MKIRLWQPFATSGGKSTLKLSHGHCPCRCPHPRCAAHSSRPEYLGRAWTLNSLAQANSRAAVVRSKIGRTDRHRVQDDEGSNDHVEPVLRLAEEAKGKKAIPAKTGQRNRCMVNYEFQKYKSCRSQRGVKTVDCSLRIKCLLPGKLSGPAEAAQLSARIMDARNQHLGFFCSYSQKTCFTCWLGFDARTFSFTSSTWLADQLQANPN